MTNKSLTVFEGFNATAEADRLKNLAKDILSHAKSKGATDVELQGSIGTGLSLAVRDQKLDDLSCHFDTGVSFTVYKGQKKGHASITGLKSDMIYQAIDQALQIADSVEADEYSGLGNPEEMVKNYPDLDCHHPTNITQQDLRNAAESIEKACLDADSRIKQCEGADAVAYESVSLYANSLGVIQTVPKTRFSYSCSAIAEDEAGMQRDYDYAVARDYKDFNQISNIGRIAATKTCERLSPKKIKTAKLPVLATPDIARGIWGHLLSAVSGSAQYKEESFLQGAVHTKILPDFIDLYENPFLKRGLGSTGFDGDGIAVKPNYLVEQGALNRYLLSVYSAKRLGLKTTGNAGGVHNLSIQGSLTDYDDMIQSMDRGVIVTDVMGQGVNLVSGQYSRGASGFYVEGGKVQDPIHEFTIAGNLKDMFASIQAVGSDIDHRGGILAGSLLLAPMMIAGE